MSAIFMKFIHKSTNYHVIWCSCIKCKNINFFKFFMNEISGHLIYQDILTN